MDSTAHILWMEKQSKWSSHGESRGWQNASRSSWCPSRDLAKRGQDRGDRDVLWWLPFMFECDIQGAVVVLT